MSKPKAQQSNRYYVILGHLPGPPAVEPVESADLYRELDEIAAISKLIDDVTFEPPRFFTST